MQPVWSIFPKYHAHLDVPRLAGLVRELGLDTTNMVVRDGFWVTRKDFARQTAAFVDGMKREGLTIHFATTDFRADELADDPTPLKVMHDNGIRDFRMAWFEMERDVRGAMQRARASMGRMADACAKTNMRAIYQLHHGMLASSPSAGFALVDGLPPKHVGIELDPGNESFDGYESHERSARLLGPYLAAVGVKDTAIHRDPAHANDPDKGWRRDWAPIDEGVNRWDEVARAMNEVGFVGTIVMMPHYDPKDVKSQEQKLKREVEYFRRIVADVTRPAS